LLFSPLRQQNIAYISAFDLKLLISHSGADKYLVYKPGKVAVVLNGRQAGKKVVVIQQRDEGTKERPYPHAIVAGIER
jgi:hypothetical protein